MPEKTQVVVLSDVHIGNGYETCWYQQGVHEPGLVAALKWVAQNADAIQELLLLGDLVDFWTYPPEQTPPTMAEIIAANPHVLGPGGALAEAVAALPGAVTLMPGNHDITLTQADVDALSASVGGTIAFDTSPCRVLSGKSGQRTVFAHGHYGTMFNAPDPSTQWAPLPIGHFVTRALAYKATQELTAGQTVADLAGWGDNGLGGEVATLAITSFLAAPTATAASLAIEGISTKLLGTLAQVCDMSVDAPIVLPGGAQTTLRLAESAYNGLYERWVTQEGSNTNAIRAARADYDGQWLTWWAQRLALQQSAQLVVCGHTHLPITSISPSPISYVNNGYECPSLPDAKTTPMTFTVVDLEHATGTIFQIGPEGTTETPTIGALPAAPAPTLQRPDYSCYVTITNATSATMNRTALPDPQYGYYVVEPPETIAPGASATFWLEDNFGLAGTEGGVVYDNNKSFTYACPYVNVILNRNSAQSYNNDFVAKSGEGGFGAQGSVPDSGQPLQVQFTAT